MTQIMKKYILLALLLVSACAAPVKYQPNNEQAYTDWRECFHIMYKASEEGRFESGSIIGGLLLGPVGAVVGDKMQNGESKIDADAMLDKCMIDRGYIIR
jgi:hypothetical protein